MHPTIIHPLPTTTPAVASVEPYYCIDVVKSSSMGETMNNKKKREINMCVCLRQNTTAWKEQCTPEGYQMYSQQPFHITKQLHSALFCSNHLLSNLSMNTRKNQ